MELISNYARLSPEDQEIVYGHFTTERWLKAHKLSLQLIQKYSYEGMEAKSPENQQVLFAQELLWELFKNSNEDWQ